MGLPIKTFWLMNGNVERISAQKDMRALTVAAFCQSSEGTTAHREQLVIEIGTMVKLESDGLSEADRPDAEGLDGLRSMKQ